MQLTRASYLARVQTRLSKLGADDEGADRPIPDGPLWEALHPAIQATLLHGGDAVELADVEDPRPRRPQ